eukprot:2986580-Rhodomonas_salina.1
MPGTNCTGMRCNAFDLGVTWNTCVRSSSKVPGRSTIRYLSTGHRIPPYAVQHRLLCQYRTWHGTVRYVSTTRGIAPYATTRVGRYRGAPVVWSYLSTAKPGRSTASVPHTSIAA